ncbi:MAG: di-heme oxidoredictase family protein [Steroidobacteraceae bacterium]
MKSEFTSLTTALILAALAAFNSAATAAQPTDPGIRRAPTDNGPPTPLAGLDQDEREYFQDGLSRFATVEVVSGAGPGQGNGLGPRFNSESCLSCHAQPNAGGSSPAQNPLASIATAYGAANDMPWFIASAGPIREARFIQSNGTADGGVHDLFVVSGRSDAGSCALSQPAFGPAGNPVTGQGGNRNIVFRIPTPVFGAGLIEAIADSTILANMSNNADSNARFGVHGHANAIQGGNVNRSGNDGTITRFGWKAQNKSLLMFAGEAYNVEMGISNQLFPQERTETAACRTYNSTPEDTNNFSQTTTANSGTPVLSDIEAFANFMRMLAPPAPGPSSPLTIYGKTLFVQVGCATCHTPTLMTGTAISTGSSRNPSPALSGQPANLYSDLLLHHMGQGLADGITQAAAGPDEFRSAPLWGLGQRAYFLHDGRTSDLLVAIEAHRSQGSEANAVIAQYNGLSSAQQQAILDFLRSL